MVSGEKVLADSNKFLTATTVTLRREKAFQYSISICRQVWLSNRAADGQGGQISGTTPRESHEVAIQGKPSNVHPTLKAADNLIPFLSQGHIQAATR